MRVTCPRRLVLGMNHSCQTDSVLSLETARWIELTKSIKNEKEKENTHLSCSRLRQSLPGRHRSRPCRAPSCCSCWHSRPASSLPQCSRTGTGTSRFGRCPGPSSRSGTSRPCSPPRWRTPRKRTRRRCTALGPSSRRGTAAPSSSPLRSRGRTHTPLPRTPPGPSSHPGSGARSSSYPPNHPHRCSRRGQSWSSHVRCSPGQSLDDLELTESVHKCTKIQPPCYIILTWRKFQHFPAEP